MWGETIYFWGLNLFEMGRQNATLLFELWHSAMAESAQASSVFVAITTSVLWLATHCSKQQTDGLRRNSCYYS